MRKIFTVILAFAASGCTLGNINSLYRPVTLKHGGSHIVDAKQRFVLTYPGLLELNRAGEVIPTQTISCAEPSPDVFSVYAASGEAAFNRGDIGASGAFATAETGASLLERTTALQALRDAYFRLCEAYGNGMIDEIDFMVGQRHNQTALMGLLAIEEMKAIGRRQPVVIGASSSASSASGVRAVTEQLNKAYADMETWAGETAAAAERLGKIEEELEAAKKAADVELGANATTEQKAAKKKGEDDVARLTEEKKKLEAENAERARKTKTNEQIVAALLKSVEVGGPTGAAAQSIMQAAAQGCDSGCKEQQVEIAKEMVRVVQAIDDNDFGPTICLSHFRKQSPADLPRYAVDGGSKAYISEVCRDVLDAYVTGLEAKAANVRLGGQLLTVMAVRMTERADDQDVSAREGVDLSELFDGIQALSETGLGGPKYLDEATRDREAPPPTDD